MRLLVTGANGMLGTDLCSLAEAAGHDVIRTDIGQRQDVSGLAWERLDITDLHAVTEALLRHQPDVVIHCAACTDVDGCESDPSFSYRMNALGAWNVASVCGAHHITLVYLSTDFVFDGKKREPYTEFDTPNPLNHYGASKLAGEKLVAQLCHRHYIVRTSWLFGVHGKSFPGAILRMAPTRNELNVVVDQVGCPTFTIDLAQELLELLHIPLYGIYHITNAGHCSWHDLAVETLRVAGMSHIKVHPIPASQYPSPTRRPEYSALRHFALELQGRDAMRLWQDAIADFVRLRQQHYLS
jgi:dTDP-4-dehydrorhamnose reductase